MQRNRTPNQSLAGLSRWTGAGKVGGMEPTAPRPVIDHELTALFPPHWAYETQATEWVWAWGPDAPDDASPAVIVGDGKTRAVLTATPTPGGSWVRPEPDGVVMHLSASDAASIKGREVCFALWAAPPFTPSPDPESLLALADVMEPDAYGLLIVSDWAALPNAGTA